MRASFIVNEIGIGLRRNLTMTIAMIITTAVSLGFLGTAVLFNQQVSVMKDFWYDKVEVSVFLCGDDSEGARCAGRRGHPGPARVDPQRPRRDAARSRRSTTSPSSRPTSGSRSSSRTPRSSTTSPPTRCRSRSGSSSSTPSSSRSSPAPSSAGPGVDEVQDQKALLEKFFKVLNWVQWFAFGLALLMVVVVGDPDRQHHPGRRVQPTAGDRHHEAGRRVELLHPAAVPARGRDRRPARRRARDRGVRPHQGGARRPVLAPNFPITRFITWDDVWLSLGDRVRHRRGAGRHRVVLDPDEVPSRLSHTRHICPMRPTKRHRQRA